MSSSSPSTLQLRDYQQRAVEWLHRTPRAGLFIEMGLGKTAITLASLTPDQLPALVIAPPRVAQYTWPEEAAKWRSDLRAVFAGPRPADRLTALRTEADIYVLSMGVMHTLPEDLWDWRTVIFDESSCFKDPKSQRTRAALDLALGADYVRLLTGTPLTQSVQDLFAQARLLDSGQRLGRTLTTFRRSWMVQGPVVARTPSGSLIRSWETRPGAEEEIREALSDIVLTIRSADHLELPGESVLQHVVPMTAAQWGAYCTLAEKFTVELGGQDILAPTSAALSSKLRQVLAGAVKPSDGGEPVKVSDRRPSAAVDLAYQVTGYGPGHREPGNGVIIWYQFRAEAQRIKAALGDQGAMISDPDAIGRWKRGEVLALIAHPAAAGHGLNLQDGGHHDIWCSLPWSLEHWKQACARLARTGQTSPVTHHVLRGVGPQGQATLDDAVLEALERKGTLAENLLGSGV